jgi:hypothetical protein
MAGIPGWFAASLLANPFALSRGRSSRCLCPRYCVTWFDQSTSRAPPAWEGDKKFGRLQTRSEARRQSRLPPEGGPKGGEGIGDLYLITPAWEGDGWEELRNR